MWCASTVVAPGKRIGGYGFPRTERFNNVVSDAPGQHPIQTRPDPLRQMAYGRVIYFWPLLDLQHEGVLVSAPLVAWTQHPAALVGPIRSS